MASIRKITLLVIIALLSQTHAFSEWKTGVYGFSVSPLLGILYGQAEEIVYQYPDKGVYLSELLWDLKPLYYAGFAVNFGPRDPFTNSGFFSDGSLKVGLPIKTGIMEDRDWQIENFLTNYSRHDAISRGTFLADLSAGFSWRINYFLALSGYAEFSYMRHSWSAKDGYYQYLETDQFGGIKPGQTWNDQIPKKEFSGVVIRYVQNWFIVSPGVSLKGKLSRFFSLEGSFNYSPLIYCEDRDDHILTKTVFNDYLYFGHFFDGGGKLSFTPKNNMAISLAVSYRYITGSRGDIKSGIFSYDNIAGGGYSALDAGLGFTYTF